MRASWARQRAARERERAEQQVKAERNQRLSAVGILRYLKEAGIGDDQQILERAAAWVTANKPGSVEDIIQFGMVQDFVSSLSLPPIPKQKLLATFEAQLLQAIPVEMQGIPVSTPVTTVATTEAFAKASTTNPLTISESVEILKRELGVEGNMADVVKQAAAQLGVEDQPLVEMARECVLKLGVTTA